MTQSIPIPVGTYVLPDPRASCKRLVNVFSESDPQDSTKMELKGGSPYESSPAYLRRWAGTTIFANDNSGNPVRGMWVMQGILYAVIGPNLYSVDQAGGLVQLGTGIPGTSFVRMTDNTACLVILLPNSTTCYTYCPNSITTKFQQLTASLFLTYGAIDCKFVDSYIVFLATDGKLFYNDDGQIVSGQEQITFTSNAIFPRNFGTDLFVGLGCDHREISCFGTGTTEGYLNAGNPTGTPFSAAPQSFLEIGCHPDAAYSVALQDQAVFWVAHDRTVRRKSGQTPQKVSNSGIEAVLEHINLKGSYALTPTVAGHPLWVYVIPAAYRTLAFDCLTSEWFEIESYGLGYWRVLSYANAYGRQFVGDSQSGQIGYLDTNVFTEFGSSLVTSFVTSPIYQDHNRVVHRRLELVMSAGRGGFTGSQVSVYLSDDSGNEFRAGPMRNLGNTGDYQARAVWFNLGQSRERVYKFTLSDPTPTFTVNITADLELCKW